MARPYTVDLPGGGQMVVNANSPEAARENAGVAGATVHAGSYQSSGPAEYSRSEMDVYRAQNPGGGDAAQLGQQIDTLLNAIASGNKQAFDEAVRQFDLSFGLDRDKFSEAVRQFNENLSISQAGLTGRFQGQPTLQAQQQAYTQQLGAITTAAQLQANPFRQAQVIGQLGGLLGGQGVPGFQAPNIVQGVGTAGGNTRGGMGYLQQLIDDIRDPSANQRAAGDILANIPTPNKLDSASFLRASPLTQNMVLQGMQEKYGLDPNDALAQIKATLPQFTAPTTFGGVRR